MDIIHSNRDTFHYNGVEYGFDMIYIDSFSEIDTLIAKKVQEGFTKCFIHEIYNTKNGTAVLMPIGPNNQKQVTTVRIQFVK